MLASIVRADQNKGVDFVVSGSSDVPVTRSPIDDAIDD